MRTPRPINESRSCSEGQASDGAAMRGPDHDQVGALTHRESDQPGPGASPPTARSSPRAVTREVLARPFRGPVRYAARARRRAYRDPPGSPCCRSRSRRPDPPLRGAGEKSAQRESIARARHLVVTDQDSGVSAHAHPTVCGGRRSRIGAGPPVRLRSGHGTNGSPPPMTLDLAGGTIWVTMLRTTPQVIDHSAQQAHEWSRELARTLGHDDEREAYRVLRWFST